MPRLAASCAVLAVAGVVASAPTPAARIPAPPVAPLAHEKPNILGCVSDDLGCVMCEE